MHTAIARQFAGGMPEELCEQLDANWTVYRFSRAFLFYWCHTCATQPESVSRRQLNDAHDLHFVAMLQPGMFLLSSDRRLGDIAAAICPEATVIGSQESLEARVFAS